MSEDPRLAQIRDLCDENARVWGDTFQSGLIAVDRVLAILDAPPVTATPPQGIDRDHAAEAIRLARQRWVGGPDYEFDLALAGAVLALVRPVEGVVLTPGTREAAQALSAFRAHASRLRHDPYYGARFDSDADALDVLASRLEARS